MALLHRFATSYDAALRRRPLLVKALTSIAINSSADVCIQTATSPAPLDVQRTLLYGGVYGLWYGNFMHLVTTTWGRVMPSTTLPSLAFKAVVDVCTSLPINLCGVIGIQAYCRGESPLATIRENHWNSWTTATMYWPTANMLVYRMPVLYRVLTLNVLSFFWNCGMICFFCSPAVPRETARRLHRTLTGGAQMASR